MRGKNIMPYLAGIILLIELFSFTDVRAQTSRYESINMEVRESYVNENVVSHIIKVVNDSEMEFNGTLKLDADTDINSISASERGVSILPGDSSFFAFRILAGKNLSAGVKHFRYILLNESEDSVLIKELDYNVEVKENISIITDDTPLMVINPEDSVRINVTVNNMGNLTEEVTLVFNVPEIRGISPFTEIKFNVDPISRKSQTFSFIASSNLLLKSQFPVYITAMKGKDKKLFGSKNIVVQNVSSDRKFREINSLQGVFPTRGANDNSISLSYSQYNKLSSMLQLQGGSRFNLPAGYIHLRGNLYKYSSTQTPVATGTSLMYKLNDSEFTIGNLSENMELPMYGRGANMKFSDGESGRSITVGAIDQNYNLFSVRPWFSDYYSIYAKGEIGVNDYDNGAELSYLYQRNLYEKAYFHVSSLKWRTNIGKNWNIELSSHGAIGKYDLEGERFTGAAEVRYRGNIFESVMLNGSGYYSDPYFPGSRKGSVNISQGISFNITKDINLSGSFGYNKTAPKSFTYNYNYNSEYSNANIFLTLSKLKNISNSLFYRLQGESSSTYSQSYGNDDLSLPASMISNRLGWQWRWQGASTKHSLFGTFEGGFYNDPVNNNLLNQAKSTLNYSYDWLSMDASYQKGAYYLYEYVMSARQDVDFSRFTTSLSANKEISKKFIISSGFNFSRDNYQGNVPSANISMNWLPNQNIALFMNGYWYRYEFGNKINTYNIQVGVTYNFRNIQQNSGKKSRVIAQVYYDHNANNKYDDGDEPAEDYLISLNRKVFISDKEGRVRYSNIPFGDIVLKPLSVGSWTFDEKKVEIDKFKTNIDIPLKQSGSLQGSVKYVISEFSMRTTQRIEGLRFTISNNDNSIKRTVVSDSKGNILTFLPNGIYTIQLIKNTLPEHTDCVNHQQIFQIEAGKSTKLNDFEIIVKERRINVKRF